MSLRINSILAVAGLTVLEAVRQPLCLLLTAGTLLFMGILPLVVTHQFGEPGKLIRDSVLAVFLLGALLLGGNAASHVMSGEIRRGTVGAVLTRPVGRAQFLLGKFLGLLLFIQLYCALATMGVLLAARTSAIVYEIDFWGALPLLLSPLAGFLVAGALNYLVQKPFASNAWGAMMVAVTLAFLLSGFRAAEGGGWTGFGAAFDFRLLAPCALLALLAAILQAAALLFAIRLDTVPVLVLTGTLFLAGLTSDHFFGRFAAHNPLADLMYSLLPNVSNFWMADALTAGGSIGADYVLSAALYAGLHLAALVLLALLSFDRVEVR